MATQPAPVKDDEATEIGKLIKSGMENWIKAGRKLAAIKKRLGHGGWLPVAR